jgi:crotonobetainyl-CoA:carnitine CoA-transferase CaiB-like acyl-CoA transferase
MNDKAYHIRERFPDKSDNIALLLVMDLEFRTMCEDYDVCINALRYWDRSEAPEADARVDEYRYLIRELEEEIMQALAALQP